MVTLRCRVERGGVNLVKLWHRFCHSPFLPSDSNAYDVQAGSCFLRRERRWKLGQAKRLGRAVTRSNLDVDSRSKRKEKEEQAKLQRHAGWIAKEVGLQCFASETLSPSSQLCSCTRSFPKRSEFPTHTPLG